MWIVLGTKEKSERVPNGRRFESQCQACGEVAMFYERRVNSTLQLYFLDIVDYGSRLVMACGACGTLYATGDAAQAQPDMISKATKTAGQIGSAIATGAAAHEVTATGALAAPDVSLARPSDPIEAAGREIAGLRPTAAGRPGP